TLTDHFEDRIPALKKWNDRLENITKVGIELYFHTAGPTSYKVGTYRKVFNVYHDAVLESVKEVKSIENKITEKVADKLISKISGDLAKAMKKTTELTDKG